MVLIKLKVLTTSVALTFYYLRMNIAMTKYFHDDEQQSI